MKSKISKTVRKSWHIPQDNLLPLQESIDNRVRFRYFESYGHLNLGIWSTNLCF